MQGVGVSALSGGGAVALTKTAATTAATGGCRIPPVAITSALVVGGVAGYAAHSYANDNWDWYSDSLDWANHQLDMVGESINQNAESMRNILGIQ